MAATWRIWNMGHAGLAGSRKRMVPSRAPLEVLHDLRATAASFMADPGYSTAALQANLGWKSREVVERY